MNFVKGLLTVPEANSRFIYTLWSVTMCVAFLLTLNAYLHAPVGSQPALRELLYVIAGSHVGGSVGRLATKIGDGFQKDSQTQSE